MLTGILTAVTGLIGVLVNIITGALFPFLRNLLLAITADYNFLINNPLTEKVWGMALVVANSLFLLALVIASIAIILRINTGTYQIKKVLTGLSIAIIASNLSLLIVKALIEMGTVLTTAISNLITPGKSYTEYLIALTNIDARTKWGGGADGLAEAIITLLLIAVIIWVTFKITLLLYERLIITFVLAIAAPLVFALSLLPTMQDYTKDWWTTLVKWILVLPMFVGLMCLSSLILSQAGPVSTISSSLSASILDLKNTPVLDTKIIFMIVGLIVMGLAGELPKKLKLTTPLSGIVGNTPMEAYKKAKPLALKTAGYARGASGELLNAATSGLSEGSRYKNLGTKIGALAPAAKKFFELRKKGKQSDSDVQATEYIGGAIQKLDEFQIGKFKPGRASAEMVSKGMVADVFKLAKERDHYEGPEEAIKSWFKSAGNLQENSANMLRIDKFIGHNDTPLADKNKMAKVAQKFQAASELYKDPSKRADAVKMVADMMPEYNPDDTNPTKTAEKLLKGRERARELLKPVKFRYFDRELLTVGKSKKSDRLMNAYATNDVGENYIRAEQDYTTKYPGMPTPEKILTTDKTTLSEGVKLVEKAIDDEYTTDDEIIWHIKENGKRVDTKEDKEFYISIATTLRNKNIDKSKLKETIQTLEKAIAGKNGEMTEHKPAYQIKLMPYIESISREDNKTINEVRVDLVAKVNDFQKKVETSIKTQVDLESSIGQASLKKAKEVLPPEVFESTKEFLKDSGLSVQFTSPQQLENTSLGELNNILLRSKGALENPITPPRSKKR